MRRHDRGGAVRRGTVVLAVAALAVNMVALPAGPARATANIAGTHTTVSGPDAAAAAADALVAGRSSALRIGTGDTMIRTGVHPGGNGLHYVSYERSYRGLPVIGGDAVVVVNAAGTVLNTAAAQTSIIDIGVQPKINAAAADAAARGERPAAETSTPRLVVLAWGRPRLAWETVVTTAPPAAPSKRHVFVDAVTGTVADSYDEVRDGVGNGYHNGLVNISTKRIVLVAYFMIDPLRSGIGCSGQNGSVFTGSDDNWGNGSGTNLETACVDALYAVQKQWDMLSSWLGRNGINGSGGGFPARVGLNDVNAFWNGSFTNFGHSQDGQRQATSIDIVAHEFGHAIFQTTPGSVGSGNENGGLNEGTGDIFGALTEHFAKNPNDPPDFLVGEEASLFGNGEFRNMSDPSAEGDPNCWSDAIPFTEVHAAAGPLNHWFYLLAQGSNPQSGPASPTCNGSSALPSIGIRDAGRIFYNALLTKTSTWQYANVRLATLNATSNLYPVNCPVLDAVRAAWDAVAVPPQSGEPTCNGAHPVCGEAACNPVTRAYISHFTELGCTGTESYYTPYFNFDGIRRSWDGYGLAGTELRTVTNRSYRDNLGCHDAWLDGNTLDNFVTIYR